MTLTYWNGHSQENYFFVLGLNKKTTNYGTENHLLGENKQERNQNEVRYAGCGDSN